MEHSLELSLVAALVALVALAAAGTLIAVARRRERELGARMALLTEERDTHLRHCASLYDRLHSVQHALDAERERARTLQDERHDMSEALRRRSAETSRLCARLAALRRNKAAEDGDLREALAAAAKEITVQEDAHDALMRGAEGLIAQKNAEIELLRARLARREQRILQLEDKRASCERRLSATPVLPARRSVDYVPHSAAAVPLIRMSAR